MEDDTDMQSTLRSLKSNNQHDKGISKSKGSTSQTTVIRITKSMIKKRKEVDRDEPSISDDDFTTPPPRKTRKTTESEKKTIEAEKKRKEAQKKTKKPQKKRKEVEKKTKKVKKQTKSPKKFRGIRTRMSPKTLYTTMQSLTKIQRECVEEMGFKSFLQFQVDGIPGKISFYIVDNFEPTTMEIKLAVGSIKITRETVHEILRIPNGQIQVGGQNIDEEDELVKNDIKEWKKQYGKTEVRPVDVMRQITKSGRDDWKFKQNFLVLFATIMGQGMKMGYCTTSILKYIRRDTIIKNIDWCSYIIDCLRDSKDGWDRANRLCFYVGPLTFLTLTYLDRTSCPAFPDARQAMAMKYWTMERIKGREAFEMSNEGFGLGNLLEPHLAVDEEDAPINNNQNSEMVGTDFEVCVRRIEKTFAEFQFAVSEALDRFPEAVNKKELSNKFENLLGLKTDGESSMVQEQQTQGHDKITPPNDSDSPYWRAPGLFNEIDMSIQKRRNEIQFLSMDVPSFDLGISQLSGEGGNNLEKEVGTEAAAKSNVQTEVEMENNVERQAEIEARLEKNEALNLAQKPADVQNKRKQKRETKVVDALKSPFKNRVVGIREALTAPERRVCNWLFALMGTKFDVLFKTKHGKEVMRFVMETLAPNLEVHASVIDTWCTLLNHEERFRSKTSLSRLFCQTNMMDAGFETMTKHEQLTKFRENMLGVVHGDFETASLARVELVCFPVIASSGSFSPVIDSSPYYILCFNLKDPAYVLIDNSRADVDFEQKYGEMPNQLQDIFTRYLDLVNHPKVEAIRETGVLVLPMRWRTLKTHSDCGIFVMRHLETYKGEKAKHWDAGLLHESDDQKKQLKKLRQKYATKILLSEINMQKEIIVKEIIAYDMMTKAEKAEVYKELPKRRKERGG